MFNFIHDDFFTLSNKKRQNYMKVGICGKDNIIQHPNLPFDPTPGGGYARNIELEMLYEDPQRSNPIEIIPNEMYHQKFRVKHALNPFFLLDFMQGCLEQFDTIAFHDEILWFDTGYWSIKDCKNQFMGMDINALKEAIEAVVSGTISYCLANRDSIVIIHGPFGENSKSAMTNIDIFATNAFLPFTEVADIYRSGVKKLVRAKSLKEELIAETALHFRYSFGYLFSLYPKAFVMMDSYPVLTIIKNPVKKKCARTLMSLDLIIGSIRGGFRESDIANSRSKFWLGVDQWKLTDISIFDFSLNHY